MIDEIYNKDVLRLAANISRIDPLADADAHVEMRSPLCGSTIEVDLKIDGGRVSDFGQTIKACALGQAAASVVAAQVVGKDAAAIQEVRDQVAAMLTEDGPPPASDWSDLAALQPAKNAKPRHGAILLPFDAVLKGLGEN
jgi:NifU-like protein involved in Fe-S cluster formation